MIFALCNKRCDLGLCNKRCDLGFMQEKGVILILCHKKVLNWLYATKWCDLDFVLQIANNLSLLLHNKYDLGFVA